MSFTPPHGQSKRFCGKKEPFAVELSKQSSRVMLKTDGGLEESGFKARVFVVSKNNQISLKGVYLESQNQARIIRGAKAHSYGKPSMRFCLL